MKHRNAKQFFINRLLRIYPVYMIIFIIMAIAGPLIGYEWFKDVNAWDYTKNLVGSLFMLQGTFGLEDVVPNGWSLNFEFTFYIFACLLFVTFSKGASNNKWLPFASLLLISAVLVFERPRLIFFLIGSSIFLYEKQIHRFNAPVLISMLGGSLFFLLTWYFETSIYASMLFSVPFFVSIVTEKGVLSTIITAKFFNYLGTTSYSYYLWHAFGLFAAKVIAIKIFGIDNIITIPVFFIGGFSLSIVLSHISYHLIETKFTNWLKRKLDATMLARREHQHSPVSA